MAIDLPITDRAREYGYVFWDKKTDQMLRDFLGERDSVSVWFNSTFIGERKIDFKYRRISVGYRFTRGLPLKFTKFVLELDMNGALKVSCQ